MEDAFIRKKQPYNLDAEQSVIGSMIMDRDAIVDVSDILTKEDFYSAQNAILYENMIELFKEEILPQFPCRDKLRIVCDDAYRFAQTDARGYDYIFADIWHDPSDGLAAYKRLKSCETNAPGADFAYWIEPTLRAYLTGWI